MKIRKYIPLPTKSCLKYVPLMQLHSLVSSAQLDIPIFIWTPGSYFVGVRDIPGNGLSSAILSQLSLVKLFVHL